MLCPRFARSRPIRHGAAFCLVAALAASTFGVREAAADSTRDEPIADPSRSGDPDTAGDGSSGDVRPPIESGSADGESAAQRLERLLGRLQSFSADFVQTVYDAQSNPLQTSRGNMALARPGRFHWSVESPEAQEIVADGERLWIYDVPLEQVTVTPLDERVSGSPLLLLTSERPLGDAFEIRALGLGDGLDWVELVPREAGSDFDAIFMGFLPDAASGTGLAAMELRDGFGQATQIRFSEVEANPEAVASRFEFSPPPGVDVIGDPDAE